MTWPGRGGGVAGGDTVKCDSHVNMFQHTTVSIIYQENFLISLLFLHRLESCRLLSKCQATNFPFIFLFQMLQFKTIRRQPLTLLQF